MGRFGVGSMECSSLDIGLPPGIVCRVRAPVKSGGNDVVSSLSIGVVVAARFNNVNFTRQGPRSIGGVHGQHPDGRPDPISSGESSSNLDTSVFDGSAGFGVDTTRLDRLYDCASCEIGLRDTVLEFGRRAGSIGSKVEDRVAVD